MYNYILTFNILSLIVALFDSIKTKDKADNSIDYTLQVPTNTDPNNAVFILYPARTPAPANRLSQYVSWINGAFGLCCLILLKPSNHNNKNKNNKNKNNNNNNNNNNDNNNNDIIVSN